MTKRDFPEEWRIVSSTSRFFPAQSDFSLKRKQADAADFELEVNWESSGKLHLFEGGGLREAETGTFKGSFDHPRENPKEHFELVIVLCPETETDTRVRLLGLLLRKNTAVEDVGTGVWVAEAKPRK